MKVCPECVKREKELVALRAEVAELRAKVGKRNDYMREYMARYRKR